ncbi:MAG: hypothetical protein V3V01_01570 [Acidimicrobiales bacterium]
MEFRLLVGARYLAADSPTPSPDAAGTTIVAIGLWDAAPFGDPKRVTDAAIGDIPDDYEDLLVEFRRQLTGKVVWVLPIGSPSNESLDGVLYELGNHIANVARRFGEPVVSIDSGPSFFESDGIHLSCQGAMAAGAQLLGVTTTPDDTTTPDTAGTDLRRLRQRNVGLCGAGDGLKDLRPETMSATEIASPDR